MEIFTQHRALLVFAISATAFVIISAAVVVGEPVTSLDAGVTSWLHAHAQPLLTQAMIAVSFLGAPSTLTIVSLLVALILWRQHRLGELIALLVVVPGGNLLNFAIKHVVQRGRPTFDDPILTLPTYSFPSGHAMASTVFYGACALYLATTAEPAHPRRAAVPAAAVIVALVCFSRVYLGLHFLSDVSAGVAEGIAWLALATLALGHLRSRWPGLPRL